jgi:hypothetical protein
MPSFKYVDRELMLSLKHVRHAAAKYTLDTNIAMTCAELNARNFFPFFPPFFCMFRACSAI